MNDKLSLIFARRSVRRFTDQTISDGTIQDLLEAAMAAPSAVARDPWHFIVVKEKTTLDRMADILPYGKMLRQAPAGILVCGDINTAHDGQESYMLQDCSAAIENLLLAASILGLGSCWLGVHPRPVRIEGLRGLFNLPEGIIPVAGIALGYPEQRPEPRTRFNPEKVHRETW